MHFPTQVFGSAITQWRPKGFGGLWAAWDPLTYLQLSWRACGF